MEFVDDDVANWYVRLNRARASTTSTGATTAPRSRRCTRCWSSSCRLLAPFAPFVTDWVHRELTGESVHLAPYVARRGDARRTPRSRRRWRACARSRRSAARRARRRGSRCGSRWRGWCASRRTVERRRRCAPLLPLLAAELNVKRVEFATSGDALVTLEAKPNFRALGKKFGKQTPLAAEAVAAFTSDAPAARSSSGEELGRDGGRRDRTSSTPDDLTIVRRASGELVVQEEQRVLRGDRPDGDAGAQARGAGT